MANIGGVNMPDVSQNLEDGFKDPLGIRTPTDQNNPLATMGDVAAKFEVFATTINSSGASEVTKTISHGLGLTGIVAVTSHLFNSGFGRPDRLGVYSFTTDQGLVLIDSQFMTVDIDDFNAQDFYGASLAGTPGTAGLTTNDVTFRAKGNATNEGGGLWLCRMILMRGTHTVTFIP